MTRNIVGVAFLAAVWAYTTGAYAQDLILGEITTLRVGACDTLVRFQVRLKEAAASPVKYRIGVYSTTRDKVLMTFPVPVHNLDETLHFAVPASSLICDPQIEIRVDDQNEIDETNKRNNVASVKIDRPHSGSMIDPCAVPASKCP